MTARDKHRKKRTPPKPAAAPAAPAKAKPHEPASAPSAAPTAAPVTPAPEARVAPSGRPRVLRVGIDGRPLQAGFDDRAGRGIAVYARELLRALAARDDLALTLWLEPALPAPVPGLVPPGVNQRRYGSTLLPFRDRLSSQFSVPAAAGARMHDVFHWLAHAYAPAFPPRTGVVSVHDLILEQFPECFPESRSLRYRTARALEAQTLRRATTLLADSFETREDLLRRHQVPVARTHVAPLGVHPRFAPATPTQIAAVRKHHQLAVPFVLYVGGIDPRKDVPVLLSAFAQVKAGRTEPLLLVLAGAVRLSPEYPALLDQAARLGIADSLRVLESVPLDHLAMLLTAASVFAFPSRSEGFGLPPLEAMACGTPVVSSRGGSLGEVLGDAALTVAPGDTDGFARELARALDDEALRAHLRAQGLARAASYTWARTAEATVAAYRAAAHGGAGA